jgi:hypothetical protein
MTRRACRVDANQPELVALLQRLGFHVEDCSAFAQIRPGWPDLILARRGLLIPAEIKTEDGRETSHQTILHKQWETHGVIVPILRNEDDVLRLAGARRVA